MVKYGASWLFKSSACYRSLPCSADQSVTAAFHICRWSPCGGHLRARHLNNMPEGLELARNKYRCQRHDEDSENQRGNNPEHRMAFNEGAIDDTQPVHHKDM